MSIAFVRGVSRTTMRRISVRLPDEVWTQLDGLVTESERVGVPINVEATLASALELLVLEATGARKRRGRKSGASEA